MGLAMDGPRIPAPGAPGRDSGFRPGYLTLHEAGELAERAARAVEALGRCCLCGWGCGADRVGGKLGVCRTGRWARVSSAFPHYGEENPLRGSGGLGRLGGNKGPAGGSGTIFFGFCNLHCRFCQNHDLSQPPPGKTTGHEVKAEELARVMLALQARGCHNLNLVSPSHVVAQLLEGLALAVERGLRLPLVYNSGGYDCLEALALLEGVVDIFMPDMKYADSRVARRLSGPPDYPQTNQTAVAEMHRQVGDLKLDGQGLALRGLLVRHLVLPGGLAGTAEVARFLAGLSPNTYLNLMDQYRPAHKVASDPPLDRRPTRAEWRAAETEVLAAGLRRLDHRPTQP